MNIEYLSGIQPGAKIDMDKFKKPDRPEIFVDYLKSRLASRSEKINETYGQNFLDSEGRIIAEGQDAEKDNNLVSKLENDWARERELVLRLGALVKRRLRGLWLS